MRAVSRTCRRFALGAALALAVAPAASAHDFDVIAQGLDNPRGLDIGGDGAVYVSESGRGGSGPCVAGEGGPVCLGATGAVTRVDLDDGTQARIVRDLPSLAGEGGGDALGPSDVSLRGRSKGYLTVGLGVDARLRPDLGPGGAGLGWLYRLKKHGGLRPLADLAAFEAANNPDGDQPGSDLESNPNSVDGSDRKHVLVADAGGNDLLDVTKHGRVSLLAVFPFFTAPAPNIPGFPVPPGTPIPVQSVPTSVVRGPDGAYYVGELTGFPFVPGAARIWRIVPGSAPEVYASGLTQITDLAFGDDGSLYVLEFATGPIAGPPTPAALIRIAPGGQREELAAGRLQAATGLVVDDDHAFVSHHGNEAGTGEVVQIRLPG